MGFISRKLVAFLRLGKKEEQGKDSRPFGIGTEIFKVHGKNFVRTSSSYLLQKWKTIYTRPSTPLHSIYVTPPAEEKQLRILLTWEYKFIER